MSVMLGQSQKHRLLDGMQHRFTSGHVCCIRLQGIHLGSKVEAKQ
jgi:hypothetical protein